MEKNYNYNYENRAQSKSSVHFSNVELASCTSSVLKKRPVSNGMLWHTTDTNEFYFDWDGKRAKLNVSGDNASLSAEIAKIKADMKKLDPDAVQQKVNQLEKKVNNAATQASNAATQANSAKQAAQTAQQQARTAATQAQQAAAQVANKADKSYVDDAVAAIEIPDVSGFAKKSEIPDVSGFAKKSEIPDVSNFAEKSDIPDVSNFAEKSDIPDVSNFAEKSDIPEIPENVSAFTNDAGYLTEHQPLTEYAKKSDVPEIPENVSAFTNDAGYLTENDLPDYLTESDLDVFAVGEFPAAAVADAPTAPADGYAKVQDIMDYVNALIEKKKDELGPGGEDKDYVYINADRFTGSEVPTSIYKVNCYEINNVEPFNAYTGTLTAEAQAFLAAGKVSGTGFAFEVKAAPEIMGYEDDTDPSMNIYSELLTVDIPSGYTLEVHNFDEDHYSDAVEPFVTNFKGATRKYGKDTYNSYVRGAGDMYGGDGNIMNGVVRYLVILKLA